MSFKPKKTHWFETYTPRNVTVYAIEALARTGAVEFYHNIWSANSRDSAYIRARLDEYAILARKFEKDLPSSLRPPQRHEASPEDLAEHALKTLRAWGAGLLRLKRELKSIIREIEDLELLLSLLLEIPDHDIDFSWLKQPSSVLYKKLYVCPPGEFMDSLEENIVVEIFPGEKQDFILLLGTPEHSGIVEAASALMGCRQISIPAWLAKTSSGSIEAISDRLSSLREKQSVIEGRLHACKEDADIKASLASVRLLSWYLENSNESGRDKKLCHIIGWTSAESANQLEDALNASGIKAVVIFKDKPLVKSPVHSDHPRWAQPFGLFVNFLGTPGGDEVDPTPLLALIVPLLFGFMFPDVGHGLVLMALGFIFRKRIPEARLLLPCGLAAIIFGVIFGDVFGRHDIIQPLWVKPLENPLIVLSVSLVFGAFLITTGLIFSGIEAYWRREFKSWLQTDAAVLMLYLVLILGIFHSDTLWLLIPILLWYAIGTMLGCHMHIATCLLYGFGNLLESMMRLVLNSISFIRVGAFALAHTGTSQAANLIGDMIDNPFFVVIFFVISHTFIIVLEGLIVFVQTSRLILFEFFIRFLKADGRVFKPMHEVIR